MADPQVLSPELALVDPELAEWARARLREPALDHGSRPRAATASRGSVGRGEPRREPRGRATTQARPLGRSLEIVLLLVLAVFGIVVVAAAAAHERLAPTRLAPDARCASLAGQQGTPCAAPRR